MSNTRHAAPGSPLKQNRYCSSPGLETGLLANMVSKRVSVLESKADRALVWHLQLLSHRPGGLRRFALDLLAQFPDRIGTPGMRRFGMKPGQRYTAEQVRVIRSELPSDYARDFLLRGEIKSEVFPDEDWSFLRVVDGPPVYERTAALEHPTHYPADAFVELLRGDASGLSKELETLCLDPECELEKVSPWYFSDFIPCLRQHLAGRVEALRKQTVATEIGKKVGDALDYAAETRCLVLIDGLARIGKTFAAQAWCEQHPGTARYVQVPSTNDEIGFFRAIAKALGVSSGLGWKAVQLRERIEDVLQDGDLTLVLDEAHYCFPTTDYRYALPGRINWIMTALVNKRVPVALVTTPQFIRTQKVVERRTNWTSEQFIGRIGHYQKLPDSLSAEDLEKVARVFAPECDDKSIELLVTYAQGSAKYLAGIESAARRAHYLASKEGRDKVLFKDIKLAIRESVIPSDSALTQALADDPAKAGRRRNSTAVNVPLIPDSTPDSGDVLKPEDAPRRQVFESRNSVQRFSVERVSSPRATVELVPA